MIFNNILKINNKIIFNNQINHKHNQKMIKYSHNKNSNGNLKIQQ